MTDIKPGVKACRECGQADSANFMEPTRGRMLAAQLCFSCLFWTDKLPLVNDPSVARINGHHYAIGPEDNTAKVMRGFGGSTSIIRFNDGREVTTTNLWTQGDIPAHFASRLPDNAVFLKH